MKEILLKHFARYPQMTPQDAVKLLYQSSFGGGHLISDPQAALAYLKRERELAPVRPGNPLESIGGGIFRLHLGSVSSDVRSETILAAFAASAAAVEGSKETFHQRIDTLREVVEEAPFSGNELEEYLGIYTRAGEPMVSHSETYRDAYDPHYRVITEYWARIWPLIERIEEELALGHPVRVAIDGPSGTGKSTLAATLRDLYCCPVYHMDDFFLSPERKTPERLAEPGGNVDYERFYEEITRPLLAGESVTYRPYLCHLGHLGGAVTHAPNPVTVLEGAYSCHDNLLCGSTLRVKLTADLSTRLDRIRIRDGEEMLQRFISEWIPLEDLYFEHMAGEDRFDLILEG